jgi:hypothetical protein
VLPPGGGVLQVRLVIRNCATVFFHTNMGVWQKLIHVVTYAGAVPCTVGRWELIYVPVKMAHLSSDTSLNKKRAD